MKKLTILFALASVFSLVSCEDWLDMSPKDELSADSYFSSATELQLFTNPLYNNLLDKDCYSEESDQYVVQNPSDLIRGGTFRTVPASGGGWTWTQLRRIHNCLDNIDNCDDEEAVTQYTALCHFFRALFYFQKVQRFGDVPWIDHVVGSDEDEILYAARDTREVVMTHMIEDIDDAIENLPSSYSSGHNYRATKWAAMALKSRFCLFEGTFRKYHGISYAEHDYTYYLEQAADAAYRLMTEGPHSLYSTGDTDNDYALLFSEYEENTDEYILSINFDYSLSAFHNATAVALMSSQGRNSLTKKFVNAYLMADGTRFTDIEGWETMEFYEEVMGFKNGSYIGRDPRLGQSIRLPGHTRFATVSSKSSTVLSPDYTITLTGYHICKWVMPEDNSAADKFDKSYNDLPVFRLGEVYLNYAEALAELGTIKQDDLDISVNLLRDRVGMPHLSLSYANANPDSYLSSSEFGYTNVTGSNQGIILEVRRERQVELAQEGLRYADLLRWKAGKCLEQGIYGVYIPGIGSYDFDRDGTVDLVIYGDDETAPSTSAVALQINSGVYLSEGTSGYILPYYNYTISFDEERDYYYPIPTDDLTLNPNLEQNPGW